MPRPILRPDDDKKVPSGSISLLELDQSVRTFGFVPDIAVLKPGDAVLLAAPQPRWTQHLIAWFQRRGGIHEDHAVWTHVGIYIGRGLLVEAAPFGGVRMASFYGLAKDFRMLVRSDPILSDLQRFEIATHALTRLGGSYDLCEVPRMVRAALLGFWRPKAPIRLKRTLICSTLYSDAYLDVTQRSVCPTWAREVWPGHIGATNRLVDVPVSWLSVQ
jgi:hypothetical protein